MGVKNKHGREVLVSNGLVVVRPYDTIPLFEDFVEARDGEEIVMFEYNGNSIGSEIIRFLLCKSSATAFLN
ncbi:hypothetical protein [Halorubrum sp. GN12_10-3_MGM]|uniref:hypothetical protein n=1 Tax=Halorubrum sp. GN12_10-3_MGM TaxID=2518113 RepID=UPI0010F9523E|nr:hypothetical protein [Halorubrum sp. GN12_10-3_MGM]TKX61417.1 hypothetical protein EXE47_18040 [Halorubrum sp. GN12_10-3_MGM]